MHFIWIPDDQYVKFDQMSKQLVMYRRELSVDVITVILL